MPSLKHETLVELFRGRPGLAAEVLAGSLGAEIPEFEEATLTSGDLPDVTPTEYRADLAVTLTVGSRPVWAVVVEAQLRPDVRKRRSWPAYVATLHARLGCPVALLVVCSNANVAAWCAVPIPIGYPGLVLTPLVFGPDRVPVVDDVSRARRDPELTVLSAMAHGGGAAGFEVLKALGAALNVVDPDHAILYADAVLAALPAAARKYLEELMITKNHEYQSDFARRYFGQGKAEGMAEAVLSVLDARGIQVSDEMRARIAGCADGNLLQIWIRRSATIGEVDELFAA